ncbi:MAG: rRNA adenine N-6-methyltransferase family protein [Acutalibacteraceae bacterium]
MKNLSDINVVKSLLSRHGFQFSKALGQNFLINPEICPKMATECGADQTKGVIEVGPGFGVLTRELAARANKVVAIELDKRLPAVLAETLRDFDNVKVVQADVMEVVCIN